MDPNLQNTLKSKAEMLKVVVKICQVLGVNCNATFTFQIEDRIHKNLSKDEDEQHQLKLTALFCRSISDTFVSHQYKNSHNFKIKNLTY